jgi:hypothetical protein
MDSDPAPSKLGKHGGRRVKGEQACNTRLVYGTVAYWLARLERAGRHDLIDAIEQRRVSAHAVACQLGWAKRRPASVVDAYGDEPGVTKRRKFEMAEVLGERSPMMLVHGELPCLNCKHMNATAALKEIADGYVAMRRGEPVRSTLTGVLPRACCQRQIHSVDPRALIG